MTEEKCLAREEFEQWIPAAEAMGMFGSRQPHVLRKMITDRLQTGHLRSAARHAIYRGSQTRLYAELEDITWVHWAYDADHHFWATGDTDVPIDHYEGVLPGLDHKLYDVRFDIAGLREMGAAFTNRPVDSIPAPLATPPVRHAGGRPSKPYWESVLVEMLRQYADGALQPARQADVERAMLDWLASQGHDDASERSVRSRAKLVWDAVKTEGQ